MWILKYFDLYNHLRDIHCRYMRLVHYNWYRLCIYEKNLKNVLRNTADVPISGTPTYGIRLLIYYIYGFFSPCALHFGITIF